MKIGIIGLGVVGSAVRDGLQQIGNSVNYYDIAHNNTSLSDIVDSSIIFVCVPTETIDNNCDLSNIYSTVDSLNKLNYKGIVAIKSTVLPGTTEKLIIEYPYLKICFVPEFLRAKSALADFVDEHDVLVVGTKDVTVYQQIVASHGIIPKSTIMIAPTEAEMVKYFSNIYNALRIVFANSMFRVCESIGADYQSVLRAVTKRSGIPPNYLLCSNSYKGFGGHCLPKDTQAFESFVASLGLNLDLFSVIVNENKHFI